MAGPGSDLTGTRQRSTLINLRSKNLTGSSQAPYPLGDPSTYGGYAAQVMGLQTQFAGASALAQAGIGAAKAQFLVQRNAAQQQRIADVTGSVNAALEAGTVGSSMDLQNRAAAPIAEAANIQAALAARNTTIAQQGTAKISALGQFYSGLGQAQFAVSVAESQAALQQYQNDALDLLTSKFAKLRAAYLARQQQRGRARNITRPVPATTNPSGTPGQYYVGPTPGNPPVNPVYPGQQFGSGQPQ